MATVTIVQDQFWLSNLEYTVTFPANSATAELTITASNFSFTPSTTGDLTATVTGDGIDGGSDTVAIISTSEPPITISYDMPAYTFAENATDAAVYLVATLDAAYPREPSRNYFMTFSTRSGTAKADNDYAPISERESFTRSEYGRDADTDPFVARKLLSDFGFAIVDDAIYEGSERLGLIIEPDPTHVVGMAVFQKPDGTTCEPFGDCPNPPFEYPVTITDEGDLPALLLSVGPGVDCRGGRRRDDGHCRERLHRDGGDHQRQDLRGGPDGHADLFRDRHPGHPLQRDPGGRGSKHGGPPGGSADGRQLG